MAHAARALLGEAAKDDPLPDAEIVRRVAAGDRALFEVLMRRHNRRLYRAVRSVLKDEGEVEDVMQQAYVSAYLHLDQFRGEASFSTWLIRIAVHEALARIRRGGRFADDDTGDFMEKLPSNDRNPEQRVADREIGRLLEEAIDQLPPEYRTVFVLREIEHLATAETAECLGLSVEAVKVRLHRARRKLREDLYERAGMAAPGVFPFEDPRCDRVVVAVFEAIERLTPSGAP